jgi:ribosomal protein L11 methyltransferase
MALRSVSITVEAGAAEALGDALIDAGALSVSVEDADAGTAAEQPLFGEPGTEPEREAWERSVIRALVADGTDVDTLVAAAAAEAGMSAPPAYTAEPIEDQDWVRITQAQFEPIRVSERLWVVPSWHTPPCADAINLMLDPGVAFGTGAHPTTRMCLRWLEANVTGGERVLDYGCGSGILAIAAMKLGAGSAIGLDIDSDAVAQARENARANAVDATFLDAAARLDVEADLVVANILANPLRLLAPVLAAHTRRGGRLALAGLLADQAAELIEVYRPNFDLAVAAEAESWALLAGVRR